MLTIQYVGFVMPTTLKISFIYIMCQLYGRPDLQVSLFSTASKFQ